MGRPRLLDLFGGAQGAGVGYARAGFAVTSVDITPHAQHPEIADVLVADAMQVLASRWFLDTFDAIHASPPCQASTTMSNRYRGQGGPTDDLVNLIPDVRAALKEWGGPWVIENVPGARKDMPGAITLRGDMFPSLGVDRPRLFASNVAITAPARSPRRPAFGVYGRHHDGRRLWRRADGTELRAPRTLAEGQAAMGIDWMSWTDLTEAIPPAYTEHIGRQLIAHLDPARVPASPEGGEQRG